MLIAGRMSSSTSQLSLNITPRHAYAPENFVPHAGVAGLLEHCASGPGHEKFFIAYLSGPRRSGKTHLSIRLAQELASRGLFPRLVEGSEFAALLRAPVQWSSDDVVIVDDAHIYLSTLRPGDSGPFVAFIEKLRVARAGVIIVSEHGLDDFACDEHVMSRLIPGKCAEIGHPQEADMASLVVVMGKQHGIQLTDRKVSFVLRRVGRTVASIEAYFERLIHLASVLGRPIKFPLLSGAV